MKPISVLFLCTGNSCRSQMAEGWAQTLVLSGVHFYSAGIEAHGLNRHAVTVMQEVGVDISSHLSQRLDELAIDEFYYIYAVCDNAARHCPVQFADNIYHQQFSDPPFLARNAKNKEEELFYFRQVRDQIKRWVEGLPLHILNNRL